MTGYGPEISRNGVARDAAPAACMNTENRLSVAGYGIGTGAAAGHKSTPKKGGGVRRDGAAAIRAGFSAESTGRIGYRLMKIVYVNAAVPARQRGWATRAGPRCSPLRGLRR